MSILSNFEDRMSGLFEGFAGSVFRSPVEPVQIARAAEKEMKKNKLVGLGKTYAPTLYTVLMSPEDDENLGGFYPTLSREFATYLMGKANEDSLYFSDNPLVRFMVDDGLNTGKFTVIAETVSAEELTELRAEEEALWGIESEQPFAAPSHDDNPRGAALVTPPTAPAYLEEYQQAHAPQNTPRSATLVDQATRTAYPLADSAVSIGRDTGANITVNDLNVSRIHAELLPEGAGWLVRDLGSTNGTIVNGNPITSLRLVDGDVITLGITRFMYKEG